MSGCIRFIKDALFKIPDNLSLIVIDIDKLNPGSCNILFVILLLFFNFKTVLCACKPSFLTICDTFEDFENYNVTKNLSAVIIESDTGTTQMVPANSMETLKLLKYQLSSVIIEYPLRNHHAVNASFVNEVSLSVFTLPHLSNTWVYSHRKVWLIIKWHRLEKKLSCSKAWRILICHQNLLH